MKLNTLCILICLLSSGIMYGQSDSAALWAPDTSSMPEILDYPLEIGPEVATSYDFADYTPINKFKYNKKIKTEDKPDKKAVYSLGLSTLLQQISDNLNVPFTYGSGDQYVILQFVVGKDSSLYNPEVLYSPGSEFSINASSVIEKLDSQFLPATKNGKPVDTIITIPVRFERKQEYLYGAG